MSAGFQLRSSPRLWGLLALASLLALACVVAVGGPQATSAEESYEANIRLVDSNGKRTERWEGQLLLRRQLERIGHDRTGTD